MYYRNRMYSADLGRFATRDPIAFTGSKWNLYEYCSGSPSALIDPTGLVPELSIHLVQGPTPGECGEVSFYTAWKLSQPPQAGGYIVQQVRFSIDFTHCDTKKRTQLSLSFSEAWWVESGNTRTWPYLISSQLKEAGMADVENWDDRFAYKSVNCTFGSFSAMATARFYQGMGQLPRGYRTQNPEIHGVSGFLPSSPDTSPPNPNDSISSELIGSSNSVRHELKVEWNCCLESTDRRTRVLEHVP
jgi:hypothetical protein